MNPNICPDRDQLAQLIANELSPEEENTLAAHIDQCPACQQQLEQWAFTDDSWKPIADVFRHHDPADRESALKQVLANLPRQDDLTIDDPPKLDLHVVEALTEPTAFPDRYQMSGEIARSGMGAILRGRDTDLGRDIAIKIMLENHQGKTELLQRFIEEAQIGGQLQHPGIVPIYDLGHAHDNRPYFTMKLIQGRTLAALLKERPDPSHDLPKYLGIFEHICQTLAYAHSRGVIHRDLKPANIMVGAFGEVQVMDWGLAKVLAKDSETSRAHSETDVHAIRTVRTSDSATPTPKVEADTLGGQVLGTPAYMPPEQAKGEIHELDERCDVFGLGAILCVILTGKPPYVDKNTSAVHRKAMHAELDDAWQRLADCGAEPEMVDLTKRCLAAQKADRPRDAGEVADTVTAYLESVQQRLKQAEIDKAQVHV